MKKIYSFFSIFFAGYVPELQKACLGTLWGYTPSCSNIFK